MTAGANEAYGEYLGELRAMQKSASPAELMRFTGEALARFDRRWQTARMSGRPVESDVEAMLCAAMHHCSLLDDAGSPVDATGTLLMALLAADVSAADIAMLSATYLSATHTFAVAAVGMVDGFAGDPFAAEHTDVCARYALELFRRAAAVHPAPLPLPAAELITAIGEQLTLPPLHGRDALSASSGELVCDILSRFRACGIISL